MRSLALSGAGGDAPPVGRYREKRDGHGVRTVGAAKAIATEGG